MVGEQVEDRFDRLDRRLGVRFEDRDRRLDALERTLCDEIRSIRQPLGQNNHAPSNGAGWPKIIPGFVQIAVMLVMAGVIVGALISGRADIVSSIATGLAK